MRPACRGWVLAAALVALPAWGDTPIGSATLEQLHDRTRLLLESPEEFRFTLFILRYPNRLLLEVEDAKNVAVLQSLPAQLSPGHPFLRSVRVRPAAGKPGAVHIELELKAETYQDIRTLKPAGGHGHRLLLDVSTDAAPQARSPAPAPATAPGPGHPTAPATAEPVDPSGPSAPRQAPAIPETEDPLLLEVTLQEHVLAESINAYRDGRRVFLPLGELANVLTLAIRTQPAQGTAEGFVLEQARSFRLNVATARLAQGDQTQAFDPALVRVHDDDIYVESGLLSRWLPVDLHVDLSRLRVRVHPRETLPLQSRLERERAGARVGRRTNGHEDPGYPRLESPYRLLGTPFIDQTFGLGLRTGNGSSDHHASYTAYLTGDFLGMESSLFVSSTGEQASSDVRFTMGRHDPDAGLLGPLQARSVLFGSGVGIPSVPHVALSTPAGDGAGFMLSNRPLNQPASFDRHTLEGDLPPGWDVELYYNDALIGFQRSRPDGRYRFEDLPLSYGPNDFRLVFHGPLGQERVEQRTFLLDQTATPAGTVHYNVTQHRDDSGALRSVGQVDWGLTGNLTGSLGWVRLPEVSGLPGAGPTQYSKLGMRAFWNGVIAGTDLVRSSAGGWLSDTSLKTRIGSVAVDYNHLQLNGFASEVFPRSGDPLRMRDKVRLQSAVPATGGMPRLPVTLEVQRDQLESGRSRLLVGGLVSAYVAHASLTNQLTWEDAGSGTRSFMGALNVSRRMGDIGLAGQLGYALRPDARIQSIALTGEKRFDGGYLASVGVGRAFTTGETVYSASLNKRQGEYGLGLHATYSRPAGLTLGLQLFIAMGREPREGRWNFDALPHADTGAASVRVFLDTNGNGLLDVDEEPVPNAGVLVNGNRQPARTNASGVAWLDRLPTRVPLDLALDVQTLEDAFWQPLHRGVRMIARPGHVPTIDFPVVQTSEIEGTVSLDEGSRRRAIGNVTMELLDSSGAIVSSARSGSDGYFALAGVIQGRYVLRPSPDQLQRLGLSPTGSRREITIGADGKIVTGADFVLMRSDPAR